MTSKEAILDERNMIAHALDVSIQNVPGDDVLGGNYYQEERLHFFNELCTIGLWPSCKAFRSSLKEILGKVSSFRGCRRIPCCSHGCHRRYNCSCDYEPEMKAAAENATKKQKGL